MFVSNLLSEKENKKWAKYIKKIEKALDSYEECTPGECSCHER